MKTGLQVALFALLGVASFGAVTLIMQQTAEDPEPSAAAGPGYVQTFTVVEAGVEPPPKPPAPAGPYSANTPVQTLMANPLLRQVVVRVAPALGEVSQNMIDQAGGMTLRGARTIMPNLLTDQVLATLDVELGKLTEAQVQAAAEQSPAATAAAPPPPPGQAGPPPPAG